MANIDQIISAARLRRGVDCIAADGSCHKTPAATQFRNALLTWHDAGKPVDQLGALQAQEAALRESKDLL